MKKRKRKPTAPVFKFASCPKCKGNNIKINSQGAKQCVCGFSFYDIVKK